jgi:hypothetical protein
MNSFHSGIYGAGAGEKDGIRDALSELIFCGYEVNLSSCAH